MSTLIDDIFDAMASDDSRTVGQSAILEHTYMKGTEEQKQALNEAFIALCGWSLETLISGRNL